MDLLKLIFFFYRLENQFYLRPKMDTSSSDLLDIIADLKLQVKELQNMLKSSDGIFEEQLDSKMQEWEIKYELQVNENRILKDENVQNIQEIKRKELELTHLQEMNKKGIDLESKVHLQEKLLEDMSLKKLVETSDHIRKCARLESEYKINLATEIEKIKVTTRLDAMETLSLETINLSKKYQEICILYERTTKKMKEMSEELQAANHKIGIY